MHASLAWALALSSLAAAGPVAPPALAARSPDEPWTTASFALPHPYGRPSTYVERAPGTCTAHLAGIYTLTCWPLTVWASTTSVGVGIDCGGCSVLSHSIRGGGCPMGGHHTATTTTVTATPYTQFSFTCAPTPAPPPGPGHETVRTTDITSKLPLPTLRPEQTPLYTPRAFGAVYWPDGACQGSLSVGPTNAAEASRPCEQGRSTSYTSTVASRIELDCAGCRALSLNGDSVDCSETTWTPPSTTVVAATPTTQWVYACKQ